MSKRDFLNLSDFSLDEARAIPRLARTLKAEPKGARAGLLAGRSVAIVLEKPSTRTDCVDEGLSKAARPPSGQA
jgi:ornithine carbamoyltransferase